MSTILELAIVILIAAVLGIIAKLLKQPVVIAYFFTGIIIASFSFFHFENREIFQTFSDLGIMFLLFLVGLEMNFPSIKSIGKTAIIVGLGQLIFTSAAGFGISYLLGFTNLQSAYIAIALTLSSTIIVVKLLSEKRDLNSLYGRISIGFLLVQDFVAILILVFLSGFQNQGELVLKNVVFALIKGVALFCVFLYLGRKIIPLVFDKIAKSQELLFLSTLAWAFLLAAIASLPQIGFPIEIGGLLAGLSLANSYEHFQISGRIKPLRDFFILIFFVILGSSLAFSDFSQITFPILIFSLFVLIGNPLIVLAIMGIMGYRKRTSFLTGVTTAQISEFSLILAAVGLKLGHLTSQIVTLITAVGIITIIASTYLIIYADGIFRKTSKIFSFFERKNLKEKYFDDGEFRKPIILIGFHRIGRSIAFNLPKENLLVVDFDPEAIEILKKYGYEYLFGDISDPEIFERSNIKDAELVISTDPDFTDNLNLLKEINLLKEAGKKIKIVLRAEDENEVEALYKKGADYVIFPQFTSGQYLGKSIAFDTQMQMAEHLRNSDLETMRKLKKFESY